MKDEIKVPSKKKGLAIGVICPGVVPIKWMMHMMDLRSKLPGGIYWSFIYAEGDFKKDPSKNYASLRTEVVEKALLNGAKWLMFIDSDVFIPKEAVTKMMAHEKDIVTGVYWMKKDGIAEPVIYNEIGDGPIFNIEQSDKLLEVGGSGLGCCLIDMKVFEKFKEKGIKLFDQDWIHRKDGRQITVDIGEDHWFFHHARELGYKVYCDTNILCDHYDVERDKFFPTPDVIKKMAEKELKKEGKNIFIDEKIFNENTDKDKSSIVFFNASNVPFDGDSIGSKPIAGSETAVINMAKCLKERNWNTQVYCNTETEGVYDGVSYQHFTRLNDGIEKLNKIVGKIDAFVSVRDIRPFVGGKPPVKKTALWLHDMPDSIAYDDMITALPNIDHLFFLSQFHIDSYQKKFDNKIPKEKIVLTSNGIDENRFENVDVTQKQRGKCIYTTTPFRGLDVLFNVWPEIKEKAPKAELHIYSNMSIYNRENPEEIMEMFNHGKALDGVYLHNPVTQDKLADIMIDADVMLYPCHYAETSCITAMESIKANTPIITSDFGALSETVHELEGIKIKGDSKSNGYEKKFIEATIKMLTNDDYRNKFCQKERDMSWESIAIDWSLIFSGKAPFEVKLTKDKKVDFNTKDYWNHKHKRADTINYREKGGKSRYKFISSIIPNNAFVMDIGCGRGKFLEYLYKNEIGVSLTGCDISESALKYARSSVPVANFEVLSEDPIEINAKNIDVITAIHLIEHLQEPETYIEQWKKSLKSGGEMILVVPLNDNEYREHIKIWKLSDVEELAEKVTDDYDIVTRRQGWVYENGREAREAVVRLHLK